MKKLTVTSLFVPLLLSATFALNAQVPARANRITFRLVSPAINSDSSVFICGSLPQLGNWNPAKIKMNRSENNTWTYTIATETPFGIEYKYTLGSWDREGLGMKGKKLPNFNIKVKSDTVITDTIFSWLNSKTTVIKGKVTGTVKYHTGITGNGLKERSLVVWLPPDYDKETSRRYPVIYMHDGQNLFDPATSSFGTDWSMDETADSLIRNSITRPFIVVGINNTGDRMSEYTPGTKGDAYVDLVINTIKPLIDKTYRTLPDRKNTYTGGSSAGGTISFMLAWRHPEIFSKALCFSPAFMISNIDVVKEVTAYSGKNKKLTFYIDNGGKGLEERLQPGVDAMINELTKKGYRINRNLFTVKAPAAEHNEAAWAKRLPGALKIIFR